MSKFKKNIEIDFGHFTIFDIPFNKRIILIWKILMKKPVWCRINGIIHKEHIKKLKRV